MFPSFEKFKKDLEESEDDYSRWDFYCEHQHGPHLWNRITDSTIESISEDERDWLDSINDEKLWKEMLIDSEYNLKDRIARSVDIKKLVPLMDKKQKEEWENIKKLKLIEAI